jgi:hypothetical protein
MTMRASRLSFVLVAVTAWPTLAQEGPPPEPPSKWEPSYWEKTQQAVRSAREHNDRVDGERWCGVGLNYIEASVLAYLNEYAELLTKQNDEGAGRARINAQNFTELHEAHLHMRSSTNAYLGFVPDQELNAYAEQLQKLQREADAMDARALAVAYKQTQTAHVDRTLLNRAGKDPRGVC